MSQQSRTPSIPPRMRLYVAIVLAVAVVLLPFSRYAPGTSHGLLAGLEALLLTSLIGWAMRRPIQIGLKRRVSVGTAPEVVAVLLLPGPLAVATLVFGGMIGKELLSLPLRHAKRPPTVQHLFNFSVMIIRCVVGALVFSGVRRIQPTAVFEPVAAMLAPVAMYVSGYYLVVGIAAVQLRENPLRRSWSGQRDTVVAEATLSLTGIMAWVATVAHVWALPLLVAPLAIAHYALRDGVALRAQTQLALEELADIVDMRDHYTFEHSRRVAELARATARCLGLPHADVDLITMAGRVHDVGKIGIKSSVLMKPGHLTDQEWGEMRSHPEVGAKLISNFPAFARGRELVLHHHERYDGKGYPKALAGDQIPIGARVLAVADAWDAMTSHRAYRKALSLEVVHEELERGRGKQFDPAVLDAFLTVLQERPDLAVIHVDTSQDVDAPDAPREEYAPKPEAAPLPAIGKPAAAQA